VFLGHVLTVTNSASRGHLEDVLGLALWFKIFQDFPDGFRTRILKDSVSNRLRGEMWVWCKSGVPPSCEGQQTTLDMFDDFVVLPVDYMQDRYIPVTDMLACGVG
jgi:hypothetical protein